MSASDWIALCGAFCQLTVAIVAVVIALRANRLSTHAMQLAHAAPWIDLFLKISLDLLRDAEDTKDAYLDLLRKFEDATSKSEQRTRWLELRERVGEALDHGQRIFHELSAAVAAWERIEEADSEWEGVLADDPAAPDPPAADAARAKYEALHRGFAFALQNVCAELRAASSPESIAESLEAAAKRNRLTRPRME